MFTKTIELSVSKKEFVFLYGMKEVRFRPVIYLASDKKVMAIGEAPTTGLVAVEAHVFEDEKNDNSFAMLEAMMRFGIRKLLGSLIISSITIRISVGADIRQDLKGFAPSIFHYAARNAGAAKVVIV